VGGEGPAGAGEGARRDDTIAAAARIASVVAVEAGVSRRAAKLSVVFGELARALHTTAKMCDRWTREDTADTAQLGDGGDKGKIAASNARRIGGGDAQRHASR
jgi:hypothetical protein